MRKLIAVAMVLAVVASLMTYVTFSTVLRNNEVSVPSDFNGLPVTTVKVRVPQPTLIIKVNGEERVRMKDPFTRDAAKIFTGMYAGDSGGVYDSSGYHVTGVKAELFDTTLSDLWDVTLPPANISLTSESFSYTDNGTAIIANITLTGLSPVNINISSLALITSITQDCGLYYPSTKTFIPIATNLASPLQLAVNDSIVIQWIVVLNYGGDKLIRNAFLWFIKCVGEIGTYMPGSACGYNIKPRILVSNGTTSSDATLMNFATNTTIRGHAYAIILAFYESTVNNPAYVAVLADDKASGWVTVFNESVAGLGADRAVLVKIDVSFG